MTGNLDMNSNRVYNGAQPNGHNQPATKIWSENKFLDKSSGVMAWSLNMSNNKVINLATAIANGDAVSRVYGDGRYLQLSGGTSYIPNKKISELHNRNKVLNHGDLRDIFFLKFGGRLGNSFIKRSIWNLADPLYSDSRGDCYAMPRLYADERYVRKLQATDTSDNKIFNLADPQSDKDAINKQYLEKSHVKPSHYNNEFKYLMTDKLG